MLLERPLVVFNGHCRHEAEGPIMIDQIRLLLCRVLIALSCKQEDPIPVYHAHLPGDKGVLRRPCLQINQETAGYCRQRDPCRGMPLQHMVGIVQHLFRGKDGADGFVPLEGLAGFQYGAPLQFWRLQAPTGADLWGALHPNRLSCEGLRGPSDQCGMRRGGIDRMHRLQQGGVFLRCGHQGQLYGELHRLNLQLLSKAPQKGKRSGAQVETGLRVAGPTARYKYTKMDKVLL